MSAPIGILEWGNEQSLSSYPLIRPFVLNDFIVDASFVQLDGFIPSIKTISVHQSKVTLVLTIDSGDVSLVVPKPSTSFFPGYAVRIMDDTRYVGCLTFGQGLVNLFINYVDKIFTLNTPFVSAVVRGVNGRGGVYEINGKTGAVNIYTGATEPQRTLFFDIDGQHVTWNAGALSDPSEAVPLLTLNGVPPKENSVFLQDSDLIKVVPQGNDILLYVPISLDTISTAIKYG